MKKNIQMKKEIKKYEKAIVYLQYDCNVFNIIRTVHGLSEC